MPGLMFSVKGNSNLEGKCDTEQYVRQELLRGLDSGGNAPFLGVRSLSRVNRCVTVRLLVVCTNFFIAVFRSMTSVSAGTLFRTGAAYAGFRD